MLCVRRVAAALAITLASATAVPAVRAQPSSPPAVRLWRLDCGSYSAPTDALSDLLAHPGERSRFVVSCYLIRHGADLLLWDTGLSRALIGRRADPSQAIQMALTRSIVEQLARIGVAPSDVTLLGISHNHLDHTGQAADFPAARLLMARSDFEALRGTPSPFFTDPSTLRPWLSGNGRTDLVTGDRDVFGDGSVTMIALPGHTDGNHGLLVRLARDGAILISGDALHFPDQLTRYGFPPSNPSRAASLASADRIHGIVRNAHATLVIEHDPGSVAKLPAFPASAQ